MCPFSHLRAADVCQPRDCENALPPGQFSYTFTRTLDTIERIQTHIRQWGAVLTGMDLYADLRPSFRTNGRTVYTTPSGNQFTGRHAVVLVGYNNEAQYWLAMSSWGESWGDRGVFKVWRTIAQLMYQI